MNYNETIINQVKDILINRNLTIAVAESVTAGHLQAALSLASSAAQFFQGGITAYNIGQKARHLHINPIAGQKANCVDESITQVMAIEVAAMFSSDYGIAITGYATPIPEMPGDKLFAYTAIAENGKIVFAEKIFAEKQLPYDVQVYFANTFIQKFYEYLTARE